MFGTRRLSLWRSVAGSNRLAILFSSIYDPMARLSAKIRVKTGGYSALADFLQPAHTL
jgi:hypothetical protein